MWKYEKAGAIALVVIVAAFALASWLGQKRWTGPPPPTEEEWYASQAARLLALEVTEEMRLSGHLGEGFSPSRFEFIGFNNGEWLFVVFSSAHDHEGFSYELAKKASRGASIEDWPVGDAILGIGSDGDLYTHTAHVCGGLPLGPIEKPDSLSEFLFPGGEGARQWQHYEGQPPERSTWKPQESPQKASSPPPLPPIEEKEGR